jgi:hypothetical protein
LFACNRNIIDETDILTATPATKRKTGGTRYTINDSRKQKKRQIAKTHQSHSLCPSSGVLSNGLNHSSMKAQSHLIWLDIQKYGDLTTKLFTCPGFSLTL